MGTQVLRDHVRQCLMAPQPAKSRAITQEKQVEEQVGEPVGKQVEKQVEKLVEKAGVKRKAEAQAVPEDIAPQKRRMDTGKSLTAELGSIMCKAIKEVVIPDSMREA